MFAYVKGFQNPLKLTAKLTSKIERACGMARCAAHLPISRTLMDWRAAPLRIAYRHFHDWTKRNA
jgi:hypothetical protein